MNYQSASRNHRTNGFKAKQAFKSAMFLALCIWLLYQFKNSHSTTKDKRIKLHIKLGEEHSAIIMGRQGNEARYSSGSDSNSKDVDSMEEKSDEEHNRESITSYEEKQDQKDAESKNEKPESNEENNPGIALRLNKDLNHRDQRLTVSEERDLNEPQKVEEGRTWTLIPQKDEAYKENIEDKGHIEETGTGEMEDGFHRFQDENGVPEDVDHIVESMPSESSADEKSDLLQESRNRTFDSMPRGGREIMSTNSDSMARGGGRKMMSRTRVDMPRGGTRRRL